LIKDSRFLILKNNNHAGILLKRKKNISSENGIIKRK
jgi:hypothetical protein